jgi:hypothetical protein
MGGNWRRAGGFYGEAGQLNEFLLAGANRGGAMPSLAESPESRIIMPPLQPT